MVARTRKKPVPTGVVGAEAEPERVEEQPKNTGSRHLNRSQESLLVLRRRGEVVRLYVEGRRQGEIAEKLEQSMAVIAGDLKWIREQWLKEMLKDFDELKARELAKIDHLEAEAWEAWRKSCEPVKTERKRTESVRQSLKKGKGAKSGGHVLTPVRFQEETTVKEGGTGDPRFMEVVQKCIETRLRVANLLKGDTVNQVINLNWAEMEGKEGQPIPVEVYEDDPVEREIRNVQNQSRVTPELGYEEPHPTGNQHLDEGPP